MFDNAAATPTAVQSAPVLLLAALTPTAVQLVPEFVCNALKPTAVHCVPVFGDNASTPTAVQLGAVFDCNAAVPIAVQLAPEFEVPALVPTAVKFAAVFPDPALDPTAVQLAAVLDSSALAPTAVQLAVPRVPMIIPLMNESFAMPTPPAMMTAPVVEDVDAVVFVPVMTPLVVRLVSVPTEVIDGCAAVVTVPAVVADVAVAAFPLTLPTIVFVTVRFARVPTEVRLDARTFAASVAPVNVPAAAMPAGASSPLIPRGPCAPRLTSNSQPNPTGGA